MTRSTLARAAMLLLAGTTLAAAPPTAAQEAPRVLALITTAEPQVQGMAFVLLNAMRQHGATVEVMLCGPAADLARREPSPARPSSACPPPRASTARR